MKNKKAKKLLAICLTSILMLGFGIGLNTQQALADWTTGKFDSAMDFNGTSDYIFAGDLNENVKTISFWIKADSIADAKIIDLDAGTHYIKVDTGALSAQGFADPIIYVDGVVGTTIDTNWHYVAITDTTAIDANSVYLGRVFITPTNHYFDGVLDDVKFYDRVLTALEVAEHYRQKSPSLAQGGTVSGDVYIMNSGKLGIGTSAPDAKLHSISTTEQLRLGYDTSNYSSYTINDTGDLTIISSGGDISFGDENILTTGTAGFGATTIDNINLNGNTISATDASGLYLYDDGSNGIFIEDGGNVGIGTTTPDYTLDVHSSDTTYLSRIYNTSTNAAAGGLYVRTDGDGNLLTLNAGGTDVVTISEAQSTFNNPVSMAAAGDVSIAYDLLMANSTAGNIKFSGPGYIETDSSWQNLDLTLRAANTGQVIIDDNAYITGTLTVSGGTIDVSGAATDFEIIDNTASAFKISQLTNDYFNITTDDADTTFLIDLPVAGSSTTTANLFTGNVVKTINIGTGTAIDTINIGTDATSADIINIGSSGAGNLTLASAANIDLKSVSTSVLTVQDADRLKMRDATLFAIGDINEGIIDDMEEVVSDWSVDPVGQTTVALEGTVVKVNDGAMKITTTSSGNSEGDVVKRTFTSDQNYSVNDRIGFWVQATATGQIFTIKISDTVAADSTHAVTIDTANRWHYEEWDISGIVSESRDVVDYIEFYIDEDEDAPTIYIDQLRYYDKDNRSGEIFVGGDGHLVLAGEQGIELQANITSSLPGLRIDAAIVEVNQPFAVNVAGDTGINYDLTFLNTGTTFVTSAGSLIIAAGDPNHSENLTITTQSNISGGDNGRVTAATTTSITDDTKTWTTDQWKDGTVSIVSGDGASQTQVITSSTSGEVINVADWDSTLGDPTVNSYYTLAYARGGDVLVNVGQSHLQIGGFKILGADSSSYVFKVSADGDVEIGGAGLGGSDLLVKQNISLTGGNITVGELDISEAGTPTTTITASGGSCAIDIYYYKITAVNDNGETVGCTQFSETITVADSQVTISWLPVSGATGYKIYRSTDNNDWDADPQDSWVDAKVISSLDTVYTDDCDGDTTSQAPPTSNTTGGDVIVSGDFKKNCATGYIWVPGSAKYGTLPGFCVMKYEASDVGGIATSDTAHAPWTTISQESARNECLSLNTSPDYGYHLMTDPEWMTLAENILFVADNWTGATVGNGVLKRGNVGDTATGNYDGNNPDYGTEAERIDRKPNAIFAKLKLSTGEYIWDVSGNVWEWTDKVIYEDETDGGTDGNDVPDGCTAEMPDTLAGETVKGYEEYTSIIDFKGLNIRPPNLDTGVGDCNVWDSTDGIGQIYITPGHAYDNGAGDKCTSAYHAFIRGGAWYNTSVAGVFALHLHHSPALSTYTRIGFRCAR